MKMSNKIAMPSSGLQMGSAADASYWPDGGCMGVRDFIPRLRMTCAQPKCAIRSDRAYPFGYRVSIGLELDAGTEWKAKNAIFCASWRNVGARPPRKASNLQFSSSVLHSDCVSGPWTARNICSVQCGVHELPCLCDGQGLSLPTSGVYIYGFSAILPAASPLG